MTESTTGAKTLERGLGLLDHVANGVERLDDIAKAAGLSRSSTHRMLTSLVNAKFLSIDADHRYQLGLKLLQLGNQAESTINLHREIQSVLERLSRQSSDATHLGILADGDVLYLAKARGHRGIEMASRPGARLRAQNTAMGKALLAQLPAEEAAALFDPGAVRTPNSKTSVQDFLAGLERTRSQGYALEDQENELGITCVAICVPNLAGESSAAVSISAPSVYMTEERIAELVQLLRAAGPELTSYLPRGFEQGWI